MKLFKDKKVNKINELPYDREFDTCEFCKIKYPRINNKSTLDFKEIIVFGDEYHEICKDCYDHLRDVK